MQPPTIWKREIDAFDAADLKSSPPQNPIVFTGSSSIRFWNTMARDMAPYPVLNRGFGGAHVSHVTHYLPRIVYKYAPIGVVLYAGDNDLGKYSGKSVARVADDFRSCLRTIRAELPNIPIILLSVKPSRLRIKQWPRMARLNDEIQQLCGEFKDSYYVDVATPMIGDRAKPPRRLYRFDGLHMTQDGYQIWTEALRPVLDEVFGDPAIRRRRSKSAKAKTG